MFILRFGKMLVKFGPGHTWMHQANPNVILGKFLWLNLRKSKQARIEVGRKRLSVSAQEVNGEERQRLWSRIITYRAGHEAYQEHTPYYPLPVVILHPHDSV